MTPRAGERRRERCGRAEALNRLTQADAFLTAAALIVDDDTAVGAPRRSLRKR